MPQPLPSEMHTDKFLTNLSVAFYQDAMNFVAGRVFPIIGVQKQSDLYPVFPKGFFWRNEMQVRPLGGEAPRIGYEINTDSYRCEEYSVAHTVDDRVRANTDDPLNPDRSAARLLTQQALVKMESDWVTNFFTTTLWDTDREGVDATPTGDQFLQFDQTASDPIGLIRGDCDAIMGVTGFKPNTLVMGRDVFRYLIVTHADVIDRIRYVQRGIADTEILAQLFGVDRIFVPGSVQESAVEGATSSIGFIHDSKSMLLCYSAPQPGIELPSAGYTFAWTGLLPGEMNAMGGVIQRMRMERAFSDYFVIRLSYDQKVVASELGIFYYACIA
ncbi:MAG: hypothetical protein AMJ65_06860 [Phycisphaerae bacterium SG8_4]|nr:MAG: hypothetical protein AMJ65_06860 [Phycisphaerae bacterium SG8_4]